MTIPELIFQQTKQLPPEAQGEVLDFVIFLNKKKQQESEEAEWSILSITFALKGMEDEVFPYSVKDLKEKF